MSNKSNFWNKSTFALATTAVVGIGALIISGMVNGENPVEATVPGKLVSDTGGAPVYRYFDPAAVTVEFDQFGQAMPLYANENTVAGRGELKSETVTIQLELDSSVEYKALMRQGDSIVYAWQTDGGDAYYDFHAHDDAGGPDFFTRYGEGEGAARSGSIVAAYTGQHGWYWLNISDGPLTITLDVAGFYDEIVEIDLYSEE